MSSMTGSGVGGQVGGPQQPTVFELETKAAPLVAKEKLGLVKDSIEVPLNKLSEPWKYQASGEQPTLSSPLFTSRVNNQPGVEEDNSWKGAYDQLVNALPPQIKANLQAEMKKPFALRDPDYNVLDNVISFVAKGIVWLAGVAAVRDTDRTQKRSDLVTDALYNGVVQQGTENLAGIQSMLKQLGPNYVNYDTATKFSSELEENLEAFQSIPKENTQDLNQVAQQMSNLNTQYQRTVGNEDFAILGNTLKTLSTMTSALTMENMSPASYLTYTTAGTGLNNSSSELGIVGKQLDALVQGLSSGILSSVIGQPSEGAKQVLPIMLAMALVSSVVISAIITNEGIGNNPVNQDSNPQDNRNFTLDLVLHMAFASNAITQIFQTTLEANGVKEADVDVLSKGLSLAALLMIAFTVTNNNDSKIDGYLDSMRLFLNQGVNETSQYVNDGLLTGKFDGDNTSGLGVALQQGQISLQENNNSDFIDSMKNLLDQANIPSDSLFSDMKSLQGFSKNLAYALTAGMDDKTNINTSITTAA